MRCASGLQISVTHCEGFWEVARSRSFTLGQERGDSVCRVDGTADSALSAEESADMLHSQTRSPAGVLSTSSSWDSE